MSFTTRQATSQNLEQIVPLFDAYRQFYGRASDPALARSFLAERFAHQQSIVFLAEDGDGLAVGFTQLYPSFSSLTAKPNYNHNDLIVLPAMRRMGVAALLLERAAQFGRAAGAARLSLSTALDNEAAQKLYESLGWKRDQHFCHYDLSL